MTEWRITKESAVYQEAARATETIDEPSIGFSKATGLVAASAIAVSIKQNNFIIQELTNLYEEVRSFKEDIRAIKEVLLTLEKGKTIETGTNEYSEELLKALQKFNDLKIGEKVPIPPKPKTPFYVWNDPAKQIKEALNKAQKQ